MKAKNIERRPILGYEHYSVSEDGKVYNEKGHQIQSQIQNSGYEILKLNKNNKPKAFTVHRLVAIAFLPAVKGKPFVNHIDLNKRNNHVSNLEWVSAHENMRHLFDSGKMDGVVERARVRMVDIGYKYGFLNAAKNLNVPVPIKIEDTLTGDLKEFRSCTNASQELNCCSKSLSKAAHANRLFRSRYKISLI